MVTTDIRRFGNFKRYRSEREQMESIGRFYCVPKKYMGMFVRIVSHVMTREDLHEWDAITIKFPKRRVVILLYGLPEWEGHGEDEPPEWGKCAALI